MTVFELSAETTVDRPAPQVWAVLADYANDTSWRTGVVAMTADPPGIVTPGARTTEQLRFAGRTWHNLGEVTTVTPGARMTWRTVAGADAEGARTVTARSPNHCLVRLDLCITPHGMQRPFGRLLARMLQRNLARDVTALRELIEATPLPRQTV
ncbi:SRPBCC family protein [Nocardia sp. NPDC058640]|uniref:SRPBCC family protein n=1 Tax=Nocardia sp. NPDC058640 TaxID=3346571 RepID=UPI00364AF754